LKTIGRRLFVFAAFAVAGLPAAARADDWKNFISVGPTYYSSSSYLDSVGHQQPSPCTFEKNGESIYASHQFNPGDSLQVSTEYDTISCGASITRGLNDIEVDYLKGISGPAHPMLYRLEASVIIPPGYSIEVNPRLGLGRPAAELGAVYLAPLKSGSLYGFITSAVNVRAYTGYPAPQLLTNVSAGLNFSKQFLFYESFYGTTHLGNGGTLVNVGLNPIVNSKYDSYTLTENLVYNFNPREALALSCQSLLGGTNIGIGDTFQAGVWIRL
jgi:hypothetical protein